MDRELNDRALVDQAREVLAERLPPGWTVERIDGEPAGDGDSDVHFAFTSAPQSARGDAMIVARAGFVAADVDRLLGGLTRQFRSMVNWRTLLLVSDFLAPRTRELLAAEDISYVDLTGNVRLVLTSPPMFVERSGADRKPSASRTPRSAGLSGAKVGQLVRFLAETEPPYGVLDVEQATGISRGYVSRILDRLTDQALVDRLPRGPVTSVNWPALLSERGHAVDLFGANSNCTYIAPSGAQAVLDSIRTGGMAERIVITGSFAAVRIAPIAAPALLTMYMVPRGEAEQLDDLAAELGLLPADQGADVVLLRPANQGIVERPRREDGLAWVNLPQLVVDLLGGTGRMPSEGEAILDWMQDNQSQWRYPSLAAYSAALST